MPVYEYRCGEGHIFERVLPVSDYLSPQFCECGESGQKVILHAPKVFSDFEGYESPATGNWVVGRRAREEDFRASGCRAYETGEREEMVSRQTANDRQLDNVVDAAVEQTLSDITA